MTIRMAAPSARAARKPSISPAISAAAAEHDPHRSQKRIERRPSVESEAPTVPLDLGQGFLRRARLLLLVQRALHPSVMNSRLEARDVLANRIQHGHPGAATLKHVLVVPGPSLGRSFNDVTTNVLKNGELAGYEYT